MVYLLNNHQYNLSYQDLKDKYFELCHLSDLEFLNRLYEAAHLACIICFLKETSHHAIADTGIIHELIHLLHIPENTSIRDVRKLFEEQLKLA